MKERLAFFVSLGCRVSDHGLEAVPFAPATDAEVEAIFQKRLGGELPSEAETKQFKTALLLALGREYHRLGVVMQLHFGVIRDNSRRVFRALGPDATVLDNFCFSMHNMQFLEERPADLRQEIFELLFDAANIATFAPEDRIKYEYAMTTERDIRNQIRYAEKQGKEQGALEVARRMLSKNKDIAEIVEFTGLSEEQVRTLMPPQASA